jgi:aspartate 1-decarboxylase
MRIMLSSKLHRGTVTQCDLNYEGSCGLGPDLLEASGLLPLEKIAILNINTGSRLETYVIRAQKNGEISLNGAAARHAAPGDKVIILSYSMIPPSELSAHCARIVLLGEKNQILSIRDESSPSNLFPVNS